MKKSVVAALTGALIVGAASTTFAAANPFSDVPAGHWAYDAIAQLAADGVIEGYGDSTFRGDREITRYEMAQMIAKAMAKNPSGADKAMLDRLAAEFSEELNNLGVRVSNLEKHADMVKWQGKIEYTYKSHRTDNENGDGSTKVNQDDLIFRFEPIIEVNDHWTLRSRIDAHVDMSHDTSSSFELVRGWAQGDYKNLQIKFGRQPLYTNEDGLVWDTEYSGAEVTVGSKLKATLYAGRLSADKVGGSSRNAGSWNGRQDGVSADDRWYAATGRRVGDGSTTNLVGTDPTSLIALNLQYAAGEKGFFGGAGYYHLKDDDFKTKFYNKNGNEDRADIWSLNAGYKFNNMAQLWGSYAKNTKADIENNSWQMLFKYGNLYGGGNQQTKKGQWAVWAGYKQLGSNASLCGINWDDAFAGTKGFVCGASYAPMDRIVILGKYFTGKYIEGSGNAQRLFARIEWFY